MTEVKTKGEIAAADVAALLRARNPLLWVVTREEARVEGWLIKAAALAGYKPYTWDVAQGVCGLDGKPIRVGSTDPDQMLACIGERATTESAEPERAVWIMRDLPVWLQGPIGMMPLRRLRNLARLLPGTPRPTAQAVIIISPTSEIPPELATTATVIEWPLPDRTEIGQMLDGIMEQYAESKDTQGKSLIEPLNGNREPAIDATVGLSGEEAKACYGRSLVQLRRIDPVLVASEKKRIITRERVLEWYDPLPGGLQAVGGLDALKGWLMSRAGAYSAQARAYGLPAPRGCFIFGISGTGKSLTAKATATAWGVPLLRADLNALKGKYVGESEGNLRRMFRTVEAIGRCVLWIDEIEKALAGATQGAADGGVSADALGAILSWMQERTSEAFIIATANEIEQLPPEFLRKGRWDELWFVDLPNIRERAEIAQAALTAHGRSNHDIDLSLVARATEGFTGAEIAALVPEALYAAYNANAREPVLNDLLRAAEATTPLTQTAPEKIANLRKFAKRARIASTPLMEAVGDTARNVRALDL